jgi:hypothetical protein
LAGLVACTGATQQSAAGKLEATADDAAAKAKPTPAPAMEKLVVPKGLNRPGMFLLPQLLNKKRGFTVSGRFTESCRMVFADTKLQLQINKLAGLQYSASERTRSINIGFRYWPDKKQIELVLFAEKSKGQFVWGGPLDFPSLGMVGIGETFSYKVYLEPAGSLVVSIPGKEAPVLSLPNFADWYSDTAYARGLYINNAQQDITVFLQKEYLD